MLPSRNVVLAFLSLLGFTHRFGRALLQYQICDDPRISEHFGPLNELWDEVIQSYGKALNIDKELELQDASVRYNAAEALVQSASDTRSETVRKQRLNEAVNLFAQTLDIQEGALTHQQMIQEEVEGGVSLADTAANSGADNSTMSEDTTAYSVEQQDEWATVSEPITPEAVCETLQAQLYAMTEALEIGVPPETALEYNNIASIMIDRKFPHYIAMLPTMEENASADKQTATLSVSAAATMFTPSGPAQSIKRNPQEEARITARRQIAAFKAQYAESLHSVNALSPEAFLNHINEAYGYIPADSKIELATLPGEDIIDYAEWLCAFDADMGEASTTKFEQTTGLRRPALARARRLIAHAVERKGDEYLQLAYLLYAEVELRRFNLETHGMADTESNVAKTALVWLKNSAVYGRASIAYGTRADRYDRDRQAKLQEAEVKTEVVEFLGLAIEQGAVGGREIRKEVQNMDKGNLVKILESCVTEMLFRKDAIETWAQTYGIDLTSIA
jgi:hypothetical protein